MSKKRSFGDLKKKIVKIEDQTEEIKELIEEKTIIKPAPIPEITYSCQYCFKEDFTTLSGKNRHEKKCTDNPNKIISEDLKKSTIDFNAILDKISNDLKEVKEFVIIGKKHTFNEQNLLIQLRETKYTKPYELKRIFFQISSKEITDKLHDFKKRGIVNRSKNGWYYLNPIYSGDLSEI